MEIKVGKVELALTSNGTPKVLIYPENAETDDVNEALEVIGELESLYALTRKQGDVLEVTQKGKWKNLQVDSTYLQAFNSANYDRVKQLFRRSLVALNKATNGSRSDIEFDTATMLITDNLDLFLKTQECILGLLKNSNTEFAKKLVKDVKSEDVATQFNAWSHINDLAKRSISEISKDYRIINGQEPDIDNKNNKNNKKK